MINEYSGTEYIGSVTHSSVHTDHLNTPRLVADDTQQTVWKWEQQEPFGVNAANDDPDGNSVAFEFNLRFPGQYFDIETNAHYNYFRDYYPATGRYVQSDPIGLWGGLNTYAYVLSHPLRRIDRLGLYYGFLHDLISTTALSAEGFGGSFAKDVSSSSVAADWWPPSSQSTANAHWHAMCAADWSRADCIASYERYIQEQIERCNSDGLGRAMHAGQDSTAAGHKNFQTWCGGIPSAIHRQGDLSPDPQNLSDAVRKSREIIRRYKERCLCSPL